MFSRIYSKLPIINLAISTGALAFQVNFLYPWHDQLSRELGELSKHCRPMLQEEDDAFSAFEMQKNIKSLVKDNKKI